MIQHLHRNFTFFLPMIMRLSTPGCWHCQQTFFPLTQQPISLPVILCFHSWWTAVAAYLKQSTTLSTYTYSHKLKPLSPPLPLLLLLPPRHHHHHWWCLERAMQSSGKNQKEFICFIALIHPPICCKISSLCFWFSFGQTIIVAHYFEGLVVLQRPRRHKRNHNTFGKSV